MADPAETLIETLTTSQPEIAGQLAQAVFGKILDLDSRQRRGQLLATLAAWIGSGGSALAAAHKLHFHRNTVLNHLREVERLTGRNLNAPADIMVVTLAFRVLSRTETTGRRTAAGYPVGRQHAEATRKAGP